MPSSDSEGFESAEEGTQEGNSVKKEKKQELSPTKHRDKAQVLQTELKNTAVNQAVENTVKSSKNIVETTDGWDDFDIEDSDTTITNDISTEDNNYKSFKRDVKDKITQQSSNWNDFNIWAQDDSFIIKTQAESQEKTTETAADPETAGSDVDFKVVADRLSVTTLSDTSTSGWGWGGWGVDSLLSSATAGITTITNQVSQGITTVLESSIGAPDPVELARKNKNIPEAGPNQSDYKNANNKPLEIHDDAEEINVPSTSASDPTFQLSTIISGMTKFVENTGTKVIAGGLDTLETIGKKTMEVLQDGDPGLAKKKAMLGLDPGDKPVLSQVLREAKARADEEDRIREEKREAKEVHYETLFDDFEGLVHLEALEMLSKQVNMRIEERIRSVALDKRQEIRETLQQVAELCDMPDEDDDMDSETPSNPDSFHERLQEATKDLGLKLQFQPLVKQYQDILSWLDSSDHDLTEKTLYKRAVSDLAHCTALCVELYHKAGEMLLVKTRRSTADEADALTQMTVILTRHISDLATAFTEQLNSLPVDNKEQINTYITNVFLEAGNSSTYVQNAFQLALPILQIGAA